MFLLCLDLLIINTNVKGPYHMSTEYSAKYIQNQKTEKINPAVGPKETSGKADKNLFLLINGILIKLNFS